MKFTKGKHYSYRGVEVIYLQTFNHRGLIRRFAYLNGACFDVGPDEISQVRELRA